MTGYKVNPQKTNSVMDLIRALRNAQGWNQKRLAQILGVRRETISDWENGRLSREMAIGIRIGLAAAQSGLSLDEICNLLPDPPTVGEEAGEYQT